MDPNAALRDETKRDEMGSRLAAKLLKNVLALVERGRHRHNRISRPPRSTAPAPLRARSGKGRRSVGCPLPDRAGATGPGLKVWHRDPADLLLH